MKDEKTKAEKFKDEKTTGKDGGERTRDGDLWYGEGPTCEKYLE